MKHAKKNRFGRVHWLALLGCLVAASCAGKHLDEGSDNDGSGGDGSAGESNTAGAAGDPSNGGAAGTSAGGAGEGGKGGQGEAGQGGQVNGGAGGEGGAERDDHPPDIEPIVWGEPGEPSEVLVYQQLPYHEGPPVVDGGIWISRPDGTEVPQGGSSERHRLFDGSEPILSPDGTRLAYVFDGSIWVANANGSNRHALTPDGSDDRSPTWSPDGKALVFERDGTLVRMPSNGGGVTRILPEGVSGSRPDWKGSKILYVSGDRTRIKNADDVAAGVEVPNARKKAALSPDGTRVAYVLGSGNQTLWVMDVDGSNQQVVTSEEDLHETSFEYDFIEPSWSIDGKVLLFTSYWPYGELWELYLVPLDAQTTDEVRFVDGGRAGRWGKYAP